MKLSEKGMLKLRSFVPIMNNFNVTTEDIEFEPDDFQDAVILTVEEACEILDYLSYLHLRGGRDSFLKDLEKCNRNLYERIEKAESK